MKSVQLIIGGDLAPTESNFSFFTEGNIKGLIDEKILALLDSADYRIFNLEVPLTDTIQPISKDGPNGYAPPSTVNGLKMLKPLFGMSNNHIMDQDEEGLYQTMKNLSEHKIPYFGAGKNLEEAQKPYVIEDNGMKIGVYACAEHEFSIADENKPGANPFDPLSSLDHIAKLKSECNYVIVLYHGGKEHYRYPSPNLQKVCRRMVDKGADMVACQHSHCIGAYEIYNNARIIYGQGNFLFDSRDDECWNSSIMIKLSLSESVNVEFIPIIKNGKGIVLPGEKEYNQVMSDFNERSSQILVPGFIEDEYNRYSARIGQFYLSSIAGFGRIPRKIDKILKGAITNFLFSPKKLNMLKNHIECEAHREILLNYLDIRRNKVLNK